MSANAGSVRAAGTPRNRSTVPEASASPAQVASRPRRIRHHRRKRAAIARRCVRPRRTGSRPSRRAVRLQGRLTPLESVRQFRPMSAGKDSPPDSGKPRRVPRPACQRFGSRHHRTRQPFDRAPPASDDSGDRAPRQSIRQAVRPVSGSEVPASRAAGFATIERGDRWPRRRIPATSNAATIGKPWQPSAPPVYPATVRQSQCLIAETETESRRPRVCGRGRVCAFRLRLVILYSFFFFLWIAHAMLMQCLCIAYACRAAPDSARAVRALAATIAGNAA